MSEYVRTDLKVKQADGTWVKYSPTVTLDSVILENGGSLTDIITEDGKINNDAIPQHVEFKTYTLDDI